MPDHHPWNSAGTALVALLALTGAVLSGCGPDMSPQRGSGAEQLEIRDAEDVEELEDVYVGPLDQAFYEDIESYDLQVVTLVAEVSEVLAPRAFTVTAPEDPDVGPLPVVCVRGAGEVDLNPGASLLMAATPMRDLEPGEVADDLGLDVDADELEEWEGQTFLVATTVEPLE